MANWKKNVLIFVVVFLLVSLFMRPGGCTQSRGTGRPPDAKIVALAAPGLPAETAYQAQASYTLRAEVADTPETRAKGLSGRRALEQGYGMIYVYEAPTKPDWTTGATKFPLSVAFLKGDGRIVKIQRPAPGDLRTFSPDEPVRFVLEARAGWFEDRGLHVGDRLTVPGELQPAPRAIVTPAETPVQQVTE
ncbi:MAG: DUF192 domain-containing protein [Planctomycetes bacterium]|nr:DUF192 domain-containing protein [Planctomycetota bacterium]